MVGGLSPTLPTGRERTETVLETVLEANHLLLFAVGLNAYFLPKAVCVRLSPFHAH